MQFGVDSSRKSSRQVVLRIADDKGLLANHVDQKGKYVSELLTLKQAPPQRNFNFSRRVDETSNLEVEKVTSTFLITSRRRRTL